MFPLSLIEMTSVAFQFNVVYIVATPPRERFDVIKFWEFAEFIFSYGTQVFLTLTDLHLLGSGEVIAWLIKRVQEAILRDRCSSLTSV